MHRNDVCKLMPYVRNWADEEAERTLNKLTFDQTIDVEDR